MTAAAIPPRLRALARAVERAIEALPGVTRAVMWGSRNFKVGKKLFVCLLVSPKGILLEFKLPEDEARAAVLAGKAEPHSFRNLAASGWVKVLLRSRKDLPRIVRWVRTSRELY